VGEHDEKFKLRRRSVLSPTMNSDTMDEATFRQLSSVAITRIRDACDAVDPDILEAVLDGDVIKFMFPSGLPFVLNTQRPVKEIWLAADRQAWHFRCVDGVWIDKRSGDELMRAVAAAVFKRAAVQLAL
jgi:CyaY protein